MNIEQYLLVKVAEECAEVAQRATKAVCFGLEEKQKGQDLTNAERLMLEYEDLRGVMKMLQDRKLLRPTKAINVLVKEDRINKYAQYSRELGILE